ncbi:MAG: hypothetical protein WCG75_09625 [Armatimonadota bacterium]
MFLGKQLKKSPSSNPSSAFALLAICCMIGCDHIHTSVVTSPPAYASRIDDFLPLDAGQIDSQFTVDGTKTGYTLETKSEGATVSFQAVSEGKMIDEEVYEVQGKTIVLKKAVGENFTPPITLIKFPLEVGSQYQWQGKLCCELDTLDAHAAVTTSTDFVSLKDKSEDALKVEVNLTFGSGGTRKLSFWFVKGKGILKTEMVKTIREPKE